MSERKPTAKLILRKIQEILCCRLCHKSFDFTSHKPIISFTGETFCKKCTINQKKQRPESLITNILIELIIQEISNYFEVPSTKNMIYTKPGFKNNKSNSSTKNLKRDRLNSNKDTNPDYFCTENNDKNNLNINNKNMNNKNMNNINNNIEENKLGNESITTIPFCEELGNISNNSFRDEINNIIENSQSEKKVNGNKIKSNIFKKENIKNSKNDSPKVYINPKMQTQKNIVFKNKNKNEGGNNLAYFKEHIREINDEISMKRKKTTLVEDKNKNSVYINDENKNSEQESSLNKHMKSIKSNNSISHFSKLKVNKNYFPEVKTNLKYSNIGSSRNLGYFSNDLYNTVDHDNCRKENQKSVNIESNKNKNKNRVLFYSQYKANDDYKYNSNSPFKEKLIKYKKYCGANLDSDKELMGTNNTQYYSAKNNNFIEKKDNSKNKENVNI